MTQAWNSHTYAQNARFVTDLGLPVVEWLAPKAGEKILDLGCGDGVLGAKIKEFGCDVVGVDSSPNLIHAAQGIGLDARCLNGHHLNFQAEFDAVFSNAALHWMQKPDQVIDGVWRALKPGGRFVGEFGGHGNIATIQTALNMALEKRGANPAAINPWYFPTVEEYQDRLAAIGFTVNQIVLIPRPTRLPTDMRAWLTTFAQPYLSLITPTERNTFLEEVITDLKPILCDVFGQWFADYVRLRFSASKPLHLP
ncbi:methyltransferase domain-containing protein [Synechococcus sp. PCC 6312]|uniref:class I SAM-dependent methyltransferase n=1 Tax=Synechococcus sp. (strain ATCC 27167 / PCC 6312) TaxID=195253 RepID=UPI00029F4B53|nr:methyltransferase domain-containing protein [Synechococcus sp. PCC 6312]AFY59602.1 methylase involved in ubiquinone/menaquinone biosynthesis [Synechococcus sp. PCC 6312]